MPASADGQPALQTTATIGGVDCPVQYSGAALGLIASVVQMNTQVAAGVPAGDQAVVRTIGGVASQTGVTVRIQ